MATKEHHAIATMLGRFGIGYDDAIALRRISMTLQRWSELECGDDRGNAIEHDETTGKPFMTYDRGSNGERGRYPVADREAGALKRLAAIMVRYPHISCYVQTDPRGAALYIGKPEDMNDRTYSNGVAVTK